MKTVKYLVIAEFPSSLFSIGDTVEVYEKTGMTYMTQIGDESEKYDVRDYPHLFKELSS